MIVEENNLFIVYFDKKIKDNFIKKIIEMKKKFSKVDFISDILKNHQKLFIDIFIIIPDYNKETKKINDIKYKQMKCNDNFFNKIFNTNIIFNGFLFFVSFIINIFDLSNTIYFQLAD